MKTAVLVDGGFYYKRAKELWGQRMPEERADEVIAYVRAHLDVEDPLDEMPNRRSLYRIFYYDSPPYSGIQVKQPWDGKIVTFGRGNDAYDWRRAFHKKLGTKRKVAMRFGTLVTDHVAYALKDRALEQLMSGKLDASQLKQKHFFLRGLKQAGVDMRIGLDAASLSLEGIVSQIILITGDVDFVPVAKVARRAGIDVLLDPMGQNVRDELVLNVDGIEDLSDKDPLA